MFCQKSVDISEILCHLAYISFLQEEKSFINSWMLFLFSATTRGTTAPRNWYSWPRGYHRCLFYLVKMMMMMIIVRIFFDNLEGHVITSPAIPDRKLLIKSLKTENTADIVLWFRETGEHQGCLSPPLVLQGSVFVYL